MNVLQIKGYRIDISEEGSIGRGSYGLVFKAYNQQNQKFCAKLINIDAQDQFQLQREINVAQVLSRRKHPNLVTIYDVQPLQIDKQQYQVLIMEYLDKGDFWFTFDQIVKIVRDLFCGQLELYNNKIIHRDLKPANIYIYIMIGQNYKITDFGRCRLLGDMNQQQALTKMGNREYASAQIMTDQTFSDKADIYSLGIILYKLALYGAHPSGSDTPNIPEIRSFLKILSNNQFVVPKIEIQAEPERQELLRNLIQSMICFEETDRPDWEQLINHPLLQYFNMNPMLQQKVFFPTQTIISKSDTQIILDQLLFDWKDPHYIDGDMYASVRPQQFLELNAQNKIYHLLKLLIAKSYVAEGLSQQFEEQRYIEDYPINNYIIASINGYRANILVNACGFIQRQTDNISPQIRDIYYNQQIEKALDILSKKQQFQQLKELIIEYTQQIVQQLQVNIDLALFKLKQYNNKDFHNFYQIIQIGDKATYTLYHKWFAYFYDKGLKNWYYNNPKQKKFKANVDYFLNLEASYPFENYFKQNPSEIQDELLNEKILSYILQIKNKIINQFYINLTFFIISFLILRYIQQ
ncbi:hypothetical protein pb186bvf_015756 [Paramecium bursaria]